MTPEQAELVAAEDPRLDPVMRRIWFEMVDIQGYPNGMPTWNELLEQAKTDRGAKMEVILVANIAQGVLEVVDHLAGAKNPGV